ncbi:hypothetical protein S7711_07771 [Stachybotrys chartarum IBT 7711]|uniref:NAD(P)-binding protein n=1 Tax=Stachybotrys chartarum (strain CBS 109288 / IBT 7711) TaxID=1280523 RepID=A0A084B8Q0_STACB|nr:hypothetical protein S7711_07771 [Stachybotrys chartarum IBT 7711]KFA56628.1 hypothetical protein S40293_01085 [Stachybotrys chartarum IBT 40293]
MVAYKQIVASNALINDATAPRVSVFVGGTSGIGRMTLQALVTTGTNMRIYLIGRKSSEQRMQAFIADLYVVNPKVEIIWITAEVSLLAETKRVCEIIKGKESTVDLLFITAGYTTFGPRDETTEGLDTCQSLGYYSRMLFTLHLLPLLNRAEAPKVINVLAGGMERASINLDDLGLRMPGSFGTIQCWSHNITMTTVTLDKIANENPNVTFIHSAPGWVNTGNVNRGNPNWLMGWFVSLVLEPLIAMFSFSDEESSQRYLFQSTSAAFGGRGVPWTGQPGVNTRGTSDDGLFLVSSKCDCISNAKTLGVLRETAQEKVWEHTLETFQPYL